MDKLNMIMRMPGMGDYNNIVIKVNEIIDYITRKIEHKDIQITKYVKDYHFFKDVKVDLPYQKDYVITCLEDLREVLDTYNIDKEMATALIDMVNSGTIINLGIFVGEDVTEKEEKQKVMFETIEAQPIDALGGLADAVKKVKKTTKKTTKKKKTK